MTQKFEYFGKYVLLEKLATGGMAEVFLGRAPGAGGIGKFVAIKRILPQFADSPEFIDMFKEEAKIAINLSHSNIVSIHEFGVEKDQFFLVMDYVEGRNIRQMLNKMKKTGAKFSIDQIIYIVKEMAAGLDHAHRCLDGTTGRPLNITHRDISPQNTMISFEGETKIVDFGIAKAESHIENTRAGTVKGKFGYMSPEQAEGQQVDLRTDIFSLGVVLWELLANDRLFIANNEINTLRKIRDCQIPSLRKMNPNIHVELERIAQKALARDRNLRYQTAAAIHRDLNRFLNRQYPDFSPHDFAVFIKTLFADEILENRQRLIEYSKVPFRSGLEPHTLDEKTSIAISGGDTNSFVTHQTESQPDQVQVGGTKTSESAPSTIPGTHPGATTNNSNIPDLSGVIPSISMGADPIPSDSQSSHNEESGADIPSSPFMLDEKALRGELRPGSDKPSAEPQAQMPHLPEVMETSSPSLSRFSQSQITRNTNIRTNLGGPGVSPTGWIGAAMLILVVGFSYVMLAKNFPSVMGPVVSLTDPYLGPIHRFFNIGPRRDAATQSSRTEPVAQDTAPNPVETPVPAPLPTPTPTPAEKKVEPDQLRRLGDGGLFVKTTPSGADVYINGQRTGITTPGRVNLPDHLPFTLTLRRSGYSDHGTTVNDWNQLGAMLDVKLETASVGYVMIDVIPPQSEGLTLKINGQVFADPRLPTARIPVPAGQEVKIQALHNGSQAYDERTVKVPVGKTFQIQMQLRDRKPSSKR